MCKSTERDDRVLLIMADVFAGKTDEIDVLKKLYPAYLCSHWCLLLDIAISRVLADRHRSRGNDGV